MVCGPNCQRLRKRIESESNLVELENLAHLRLELVETS